MILYIKPVQTGLRKFNFIKENLNLMNYLILLLILNQVKGQFNLNPSKNKELDNKYYVNQLQNHRITDQRISDQTDQTKPNDQFVESNPIRVEDNKETNSLPDRFTNRYQETSSNDLTSSNRYQETSSNDLTSSNRYQETSSNDLTSSNTYQDTYTPNNNNYNTQPNSNFQTDNNNGLTSPINTIGSTVGSSTSFSSSSSSNSNPITSESSALNTISDQQQSSFATLNSSPSNYETSNYPNSQAIITKTQMGRLQSTTPQDNSPEFQSSPHSNLGGGGGQRFSPTGQQQQYSPSSNNMMGSPSLISSIFSKFNQPMGTYYPYGSLNSNYYGMSYPNNYYSPNYYGSSMYGTGGSYPSSYGNMGSMGGGGNFIANAFYSKMRPLMSFFQRLTGKFNPQYSMYGGGLSPYSTYGNPHTNNLYNQYGGNKLKIN